MGVRKIVTSCPLYMYQFASIIEKDNIGGIEAADLPLLLYRSVD